MVVDRTTRRPVQKLLCSVAILAQDLVADMAPARARCRDVAAIAAVLEKHMKSPGFVRYGEDLEDSPVLLPPNVCSLGVVVVVAVCNMCAHVNPRGHLPAFLQGDDHVD